MSDTNESLRDAIHAIAPTPPAADTDNHIERRNDTLLATYQARLRDRFGS